MNIAVLDSSQEIVSNGLVLNLDAAQKRSYPGSGTTWTDISGSGNDGTLTNGPTFNSGNGGSIVFDGTNDYVNLAQTYNFSSGVSLEAMVRATSINQWSRIIAFFDQFNFGAYTIALQRWSNTNDINFTIGGDSILSSGTYTTNAWHHFVGTCNGSTLALYKNGQVSASKSSAVFPNNVTRPYRYIGRSDYTNDPYYVGNIAIVRVYTRGLSGTEILQNFNCVRSRFGL